MYITSKPCGALIVGRVYQALSSHKERRRNLRGSRAIQEGITEDLNRCVREKELAAHRFLGSKPVCLASKEADWAGVEMKEGKQGTLLDE